jgi:hypothetical protein
MPVHRSTRFRKAFLFGLLVPLFCCLAFLVYCLVHVVNSEPSAEQEWARTQEAATSEQDPPGVEPEWYAAIRERNHLAANGATQQVGDFLPVQVLGEVPPVIIKRLITGEAAVNALDPYEPIVGVTIGTEARAYPLQMMSFNPAHELINDQLGGKKIGITWCSICNSGIVFDRTLDELTCTLCIAGSLWNRNMVMKDIETGTEWSQLLGKAMRGQLQGKCLTQIPCVLTDWKTWHGRYPQSSIAWSSITAKYPTDHFRQTNLFALCYQSELVCKAWSLDLLASQFILNDNVADHPVLALLDPVSHTARLFDRQVDGIVLTFEMRDGNIVDKEGGTTWDPITGRALQGKLQGHELTAMPGFIAYRAKWNEFHRDQPVQQTIQ